MSLPAPDNGDRPALLRPAPRLLSSGEAAVTIELGDTVDADVNAHVIALAAAIESRKVGGIREIVPTYRSVLVEFDPLRVSRKALSDVIAAAWEGTDFGTAKARHWRVPVCYGGPYGIDLTDFAHARDMSEDEVVRRHTTALYRIYMIGFAPGFAYLGGVDPSLHTPRRDGPRLRTPAGSVSIGGQQSAISPPIEIPSGWHLLGRTPIRSYDPDRAVAPFLFAAGDHVTIFSISEALFRDMTEAAAAGEVVAELESVS